MTDPDVQLPEFPITLRGYEREHVDRYIQRLQRRLDDALASARASEPELSAEWHAQVGPRISQIFDLAAAEAADIRANAEEDAEVLLADARRQATETISTADAQGREIGERRRTEMEEALDGFSAQRESIRREVEALEERRTAVLEELRRLHASLGMAPGLVEPALEPEPEAVPVPVPVPTTTDPPPPEFDEAKTQVLQVPETEQLDVVDAPTEAHSVIEPDVSPDA